MSIEMLLRHPKYRLPVVLVVLCILLQCLSSWLDPYLSYQHQGLSQGQWWRLWTPYLIHTNWPHLLMNIAALAVLTYLHGSYYRPLTFSMLLFIGFPLISLLSYFFSATSFQFVGLSGWLHAILVWGALVDTRRHFTSGWLILAGVAAKVSWEQWHGAEGLTEQLINAKVATDAHLWGACSGVVLFGLTMLAMVRKVYLRRSSLPYTTPIANDSDPR